MLGVFSGETRGTGQIRKSHHIRVFPFDSELVELSNLGYRCSTYRLGRGYKTHIGEGVFGNKRVWVVYFLVYFLDLRENRLPLHRGTDRSE